MSSCPREAASAREELDDLERERKQEAEDKHVGHDPDNSTLRHAPNPTGADDADSEPDHQEDTMIEPTERQQVSLSQMQIVHSPLTVRGVKFPVDKQPSRSFDPYEEVVVIAVGRINNRLTVEETDAGWMCSATLDLTECYDVDEDEVAALLERRRKEVTAAVAERFAPQ